LTRFFSPLMGEQEERIHPNQGSATFLKKESICFIFQTV